MVRLRFEVGGKERNTGAGKHSQIAKTRPQTTLQCLLIVAIVVSRPCSQAEHEKWGAGNVKLSRKK